MAAVGIGMLVNQATYREAAQFVGGLPFIYFSGILALVTGLYILNVHNVWAPDWRSAVTAVGWLLTCVGAFRIVAPQFSSFVASAIIANGGFFIGAGIVLLGIGGFITFKSYVA
ncbi:MAG TPA: hypothetical protein VLN61_02715 [Pseudolabrys sp.]|nr:hypothetical protein [Pseudolabrys sp.]